jgi:hypothetical protein
MTHSFPPSACCFCLIGMAAGLPDSICTVSDTALGSAYAERVEPRVFDMEVDGCGDVDNVRVRS